MIFLKCGKLTERDLGAVVSMCEFLLKIFIRDTNCKQSSLDQHKGVDLFFLSEI